MLKGMVLYRAALFLGLLAVGLTCGTLWVLPPGTLSYDTLQVPSNVLSMLVHYASAKLGNLRSTGQVGDGREAYVLDYVRQHVPPGDANRVLETIDKLAWSTTFLMNVGPDKGLILDSVVHQERPCLALEIGTYIGYSAIRIGKELGPECKLYCVEFNPLNADIARGMIKHAGLEGIVEVITGTLETAVPVLRREKGVETFDLVFIDHFKRYYLHDLILLKEKAFLRKGSVVVADNVGYPGAPDYLEYMERSTEFETVKHVTKLEYSKTVEDLVLVSTYRTT